LEAKKLRAMNCKGVKIYYDLLKIIGWALFPMLLTNPPVDFKKFWRIARTRDNPPPGEEIFLKPP